MKLGQHFLVNKNAILTFVSYIDFSLRPLIEIGGGTGNITQFLNPDIVIELDEKFSSRLPNLVIGDARFLPVTRGQIVSSLPYYITFDFFEEVSRLSNIKKLSLILQYDFVNKIMEEPTYISYLTNYYYDIERKDILPPDYFYPKPKVYSVIVLFTRKVKYNEKVNRILKCISRYRNKKLKNIFELCKITYKESKIVHERKLREFKPWQVNELLSLINTDSA